jgi:hypothetical protein
MVDILFHILSRSCGNTEINGEAWLSCDPHKVEITWEENEERKLRVFENKVWRILDVKQRK